MATTIATSVLPLNWTNLTLRDTIRDAFVAQGQCTVAESYNPTATDGNASLRFSLEPSVSGKNFNGLVQVNASGITFSLGTSWTTATKTLVNTSVTAPYVNFNKSASLEIKSIKIDNEFRLIAIKQGTVVSLLGFIYPFDLNEIDESQYSAVQLLTSFTYKTFQGVAGSPFGPAAANNSCTVLESGNLSNTNHVGKQDIIPGLVLLNTTRLCVFGVTSSQIGIAACAGMQYDALLGTDWRVLIPGTSGLVYKL